MNNALDCTIVGTPGNGTPNGTNDHDTLVVGPGPNASPHAVNDRDLVWWSVHVGFEAL